MWGGRYYGDTYSYEVWVKKTDLAKAKEAIKEDQQSSGADDGRGNDKKHGG